MSNAPCASTFKIIEHVHTRGRYSSTIGMEERNEQLTISALVQGVKKKGCFFDVLERSKQVLGLGPTHATKLQSLHVACHYPIHIP